MEKMEEKHRDALPLVGKILRRMLTAVWEAGRRSKTVCSWMQRDLLNFLMISMMELVFFFLSFFLFFKF